MSVSGTSFFISAVAIGVDYFYARIQTAERRRKVLQAEIALNIILTIVNFGTAWYEQKFFKTMNYSFFSSLATGWSKWEEWDELYEEIKMHSSSARTMIFFGFLNSILYAIVLYYAIVAYNQGFYYLYQHVQDGNFFHLRPHLVKMSIMIHNL